MSTQHPSGIDQRIVDKVMARRGSLHRYTSLDPRTTVLVVIDLDVKTVQLDPRLLEIIEPINRVAQRVRATGGRVAWVTTPIGGDNIRFYRDVLGDDMVRQMIDREDLDLIESKEEPEDHPLPLHPDLNVQPEDIQSVKLHYSAFGNGVCDLVPQLYGVHERDGEPTFLFAGTVTNVCVESSVRDVAELGMRAIVLSDAVVGHSHGLHEASLAVMYRNFGDVRPSGEVIDLLSAPSPKPMFEEAAVVAAFRLPIPSGGLVELADALRLTYGGELTMQQRNGWLTFQVGHAEGAQELP